MLNFRFGLFLTCTVSASCVFAQTPALVDAVSSAARSGATLERLIQGQRYTVVPLRGAGCPTVGVIHHEQRQYRGGPRIDTYKVCDGEALPEMIDDVSPALPDDREFKALTAMTIRTALRYGGDAQNWFEYRVDAQRLSELNGRGCALVETKVSADGLLVSYNVGQICN